MKGPFLFDDYSDLTSPASNHMPDTCIDITVSVEYDTLKNYFSYLYVQVCVAMCCSVCKCVLTLTSMFNLKCKPLL